jgi:hypothetical protein
MYQIITRKSKVSRPVPRHSAGRDGIPRTAGKNQKLRIISAWRYPGKSPKGQLPEIPEDILKELENLIKI